MSGLRKIAELPKPSTCSHSEHNPPSMIVLENGVYEYTCPGCGQRTIFTVSRPTYIVRSWSGTSRAVSRFQQAFDTGRAVGAVVGELRY